MTIDSGTDPFLSPADIAAWPPLAPPRTEPNRPLRAALEHHEQLTPGQIAGRCLPIGCVALEITQRCNLDCTLCYLSEHSEATHDLPLPEVLRRADAIADTYGPGVSVQITGGDPTLRDRAELVAIVRHVAARGLVPALFTNGIKATRGLLRDLAAVGLRDVAFHVDMTQERRGYATEIELNAIRRDYIERARGLGLHILFNTTVTQATLPELPALVRFFVKHAADVHLASFQPQADTGRGVAGGAGEALTLASVLRLIEQGAGAPLHFDALRVGHTDCNRYAATLVAGERVAPLLSAPGFAGALVGRLPIGPGPLRARHNRLARAKLVAVMVARNLDLLPQALRQGAATLRGLGGLRGVLRAKGRVDKLSFYVHDFMDAARLDRARCESCVFVVMTRDGPMSMCVHNAKRDAMILQPIHTEHGTWQPLRGKVVPEASPPPSTAHGLKRSKGRTRQALLRGRQKVISVSE